MQHARGPRLLGGYLSDRWTERANIAKFWGVMPDSLKNLPDIELQRMREFTVRSIEAQNAAIEAARMGVPTPGKTPPKRGPQPGDTIVDRSMPRGIDD